MKLKQHDAYRWEIPKTGQMNVPGRIYASADMLREKHQLEPLNRVINMVNESMSANNGSERKIRKNIIKAGLSTAPGFGR